MTSPRQLPLPLQHAASLAGEDFLVAGPNREAFGWLQRWPTWPSAALIVHGPAGCGKTHLAHLFLGQTQGLLVTHETLRATPAEEIAAAAAACIVDDADQAVAAGLDRSLLHLHNALAERSRHLLLCSRLTVQGWRIGLADLRSRLMAAVSVAIDPPDDELMAAVLVKLFADRHLPIEEEVILYALPRVERSFDSARCLVADLDATALSRKQRITIPLLREVLRARGGDETG